MNFTQKMSCNFIYIHTLNLDIYVYTIGRHTCNVVDGLRENIREMTEEESAFGVSVISSLHTFIYVYIYLNFTMNVECRVCVHEVSLSL